MSVNDKIKTVGEKSLVGKGDIPLLKGDTGEPGPKGDKGDKGETGPQGIGIKEIKAVS